MKKGCTFCKDLRTCSNAWTEVSPKCHSFDNTALDEDDFRSSLRSVPTVDLIHEILRRNEEEMEEVAIDCKGGTFALNKNGFVAISLETPIGKLIAEADTKDITGSDYDAMFIGLDYEKGTYVDLLAAVVDKDKPDVLKMKIYGSVFSDEPTEEQTIKREDLDNASFI